MNKNNNSQAEIHELIESAAPCHIEEVTGVTSVQDNNYNNLTVTGDVTAGVNDVTPTTKPHIPKLSERPRFIVFDNWHEENGDKYRAGVWYFGKKGLKEETISIEQWICSPLHIDAITLDSQYNNYGRLLRFRNTSKRWRKWAMPMEMLRGSGEELRGELLSMGVEIDFASRTLLTQYLQNRHPSKFIFCALQVGWCDGSFVLPDIVIGEKASEVIFQSGERDNNEYTCAGTLEGWKINIAARAKNNPMLIIAISIAFSAPLLEKCNAENGGFHFQGNSATGKTGLTEGACSVWGGENYKRSWRSTANGMEGVAAMFNDSLLALDEISECDAREVGAIVYSLGNGRGKQRASRTGNARGVKRWRCFVISNGERSIETTMSEGGHRIKAGQLVRLPSVPVARNYGVWDDLHNMESGAAFTDAIKLAAKQHHGHAGREFLEKLTRDKRDFCSTLERIKALPKFSMPESDGQFKRVAGRFALVAMAGELATEYGLTGWEVGKAVEAAAIGLNAWRSTLSSSGNAEKHQVIERMTAFIEKHGDSRFSDADNPSDMPVRDRAGWWRDSEDGRTYLFTAAGMREALKGMEFKDALDELQRLGVLPPSDASGERAKALRISGRQLRLYVVNAENFGGVS